MGTYYRLVKPGIVYGNAMTAIAAFVFASAGHPRLSLLLAMLAGLSFSIAAACVVNNVLDRDIDARMERTRARAIPTGQVSVQRALLFAAALGIAGFATLFFFTNLLALLATLFGVVVYLALYTPAKRVTPHSTLIGAFAGAVPPVVGYVAVVNAFDRTALLLFLILVAWQMTHFFAIALFRVDDYREAGLPVMPVRKGVARTKALMLAYALLFAFTLFALSAVHRFSAWHAVPVGLLAAGWIALSVSGFAMHDDARWGRRMFFYSLVMLTAFCIALALA